jgi:DNA-binding NarL/FixJ family response regulator
VTANPPATITVLTVDDHEVLREGVATIVAAQPDMIVVGEAGNGVEAIEQFRKLRPDVTLIDLHMPDGSGMEIIKTIRSEFADARFVVLTNCTGDVQALRALRAGASGYLLKSMLRTELIDTIRAVHAGQRRVPPDIAVQIAQYAPDGELTDREIDILRFVAEGFANKRIATELSISLETVKAHMKSILAKLRAEDRTHAVTIALRRGVFDL